eukprot:784042-Prorocentrum_minimum.AAC.1
MKLVTAPRSFAGAISTPYSAPEVKPRPTPTPVITRPAITCGWTLRGLRWTERGFEGTLRGLRWTGVEVDGKGVRGDVKGVEVDGKGVEVDVKGVEVAGHHHREVEARCDECHARHVDDHRNEDGAHAAVRWDQQAAVTVTTAQTMS